MFPIGLTLKSKQPGFAVANTAEELAALQAKLDRLSKLAQQGNVSDTEVQEARSQVDQAEASLLTARSELQEATALAELLAKSSVGARPDNTSGELASLRKLVEEQFLAVTETAENWAQTGQRQTPQDPACPMRISA